MRLPVDATLILIGDLQEDTSAGPLIAAWVQERLPILRVDGEAFKTERVQATLDRLGATTLVIFGGGDAEVETAGVAAALGFRVFLVAETPLVLSADIARIVTPDTAVAAALRARGRERWKAARDAALLAGR